jgi:hypothetical protein
MDGIPIYIYIYICHHRTKIFTETCLYSEYKERRVKVVAECGLSYKLQTLVFLKLLSSTQNRHCGRRHNKRYDSTSLLLDT